MGINVDLPLRGTAYVFGDDVPGDDGIVPFRVVSNIYETAKTDFGALAMTPVDPSFPSRFERGGFIVAGRNFPTGITHEQAIWALVQVGVAGVIADTMNAGFFQAALNDGLPALAIPGVSSIVREGDELEVVLRTATVRNLTTGEEIRGALMPDRLAAVLRAGGKRAYAALRYRERRKPSVSVG